MKPSLWIIIACAMAAAPTGLLWGQETAPPAATVDHQAAEEQYKRLNSAIEELLAANVAQQKRLAALAEEMQQLREEVARLRQPPANFASLEDLRLLAKKVQELDENREADKKRILEELQKLSKAKPPAPAEVSGAHTNAPKKNEKGYEYVVKKNDSLLAIVAEYRKQGVKVTLDQVLKANPTLKPNNLQVDQKIFIPDPSLP